MPHDLRRQIEFAAVRAVCGNRAAGRGWESGSRERGTEGASAFAQTIGRG
jgi:hypothetical protein